MSLILVVDDEKDIRDIIAETLVDEGYNVETAKNASEAIDCINRTMPSAVLLDIWLEGSKIDGLGILKRVKQKYPNVPVIMISGHGNIKTAVGTIKNGAYDFLEKPFKIERLLLTLERAIDASNIESENSLFKNALANSGDLVCCSKLIKGIIKECKALAPTNSRIILEGELGTGKEFFAHFIHSLSLRSRKPFVALNAAKFSESNLMNELLGKENDGKLEKVGMLEKADGGTLYIDSIDKLPAALQSKMLHFLQNGKYNRDGSDKEHQSDVRVIASSTKDLEQLAKDGEFNTNLYHRLNSAKFFIPPLRERKEDVAPLANYFIEHLSSDLNSHHAEFDSDVIALFESYDWPGNIRQLKNIVESMLIHNKGGTSLDISLVPNEIVQNIGKQFQSFGQSNLEIYNKSLKDAREIFEREYIKMQLQKFSGNISKTAEYIGMDRTALHRKMKALNIVLDIAE